MTSISSNNIQHSETSFATGVGAVAGFGGYVASEALLSKTRNRYLYKSLEKIPQYGDEYLKVANTVIKEKNLDIKIIHPDKMPKELKFKEPKNIKGLKLLWYKFKVFMLNSQYQSSLRRTSTGKNAFVKGKILCLNEKLFSSSVFHELGHVLNKKSLLGRNLQKLRFKSILAPIFLLGAALLTPKKTDAQKEKQGFIGKTMTFIKENVGKLSMLAMTPVLIEELMANHQGAKIAKQYLSGDALKPALKTNRWSAIGYISVIGVVGLAVSIGNKIRDMVANKVSS